MTSTIRSPGSSVPNRWMMRLSVKSGHLAWGLGLDAFQLGLCHGRIMLQRHGRDPLILDHVPHEPGEGHCCADRCAAANEGVKFTGNIEIIRL